MMLSSCWPPEQIAVFPWDGPPCSNWVENKKTLGSHQPFSLAIAI